MRPLNCHVLRPAANIATVMHNLKSSNHTGELLSALADGELRNEELAAALVACSAEGDGSDDDLGRWGTYHLIGDMLRSQAREPGPDTRFIQLLCQRLAREPAIAPVKHALPSAPPCAQASNDESFRWNLVAGVAALAAVSAISWNVSGLFSPAAAPQLAKASAPQQVLVASPMGPVLRDARLEELLAAHRQLGGASALQAPSNFFRNATFDAAVEAGR
jgi:sigma-E factor negative regulatory protein RseA